MSDEQKTEPETQGIVLYTSSVSGNMHTEKNTERVRFLLQAAKAPFVEVDVSLSTIDKEYLHQHSKHANKIILPQVFVDGEYVGSCVEIDEANEYGELKDLLRLR